MLAIFGARPARFFMTNPECPNCRSIGWVCENHPDKPSMTRLAAPVARACRVNATGDEPDISQIIEEKKPTLH
jgi:hypothetical protein